MHIINNIPRYFEPHVNDCFHNTLAGCLLFKHLNPNIVLADYLSFMYDSASGIIGLNYLNKYLISSASVEFSEEELNTSLEFAYLPETNYYGRSVPPKLKDHKINIIMHIHDDVDVAQARVKELIDSNIPVIIAVDLYYVPNHNKYKKQHVLHNIIINGYDEEENIYYVIDKFPPSGSDFDGKISIPAINEGRSSDNPQSNPITGNYSRPIRNLWAEITIGDAFKIQEEKLINVIKESCLRMNGQRQVLGQPCGLQPLEAFKNDVFMKLKDDFNEKYEFYFKRYIFEAFKDVSRSRKRFGVFINEIKELISSEIAQEVSAKMDSSAKSWEIASNLAYKLALVKKMDLIHEIVKQLQVIIETEKEAVYLLSRGSFMNTEKTV